MKTQFSEYSEVRDLSTELAMRISVDQLDYHTLMSSTGLYDYLYVRILSARLLLVHFADRLSYETLVSFRKIGSGYISKLVNELIKKKFHKEAPFDEERQKIKEEILAYFQ
ncbi:MAG: hypothetical protein KAS02_02605 [Candidatus Pacebacteria bacterium]|nr:hypothetical protein [Candidatus Paceibacterota bacterium]